MSQLKSLAYAVFVVFICIVPVFSYAQTEGRFLDVPNVQNDSSKRTMTIAIIDALSKAGHVVSDETEMNETARRLKFREHYWDSGKDIAKINEFIRHDALIQFDYQKGKKKSSLIITIYNAYTGEKIGDFERPLKKSKLSSADTKAIVKAVNSTTSGIIPIEYPDKITITINSVPAGATITSGTDTIGVTPFEITRDAIKSGSEQWTVTYPGREPVTQLVLLDKTATYDYDLSQEAIKPSSFLGERGKVKGGTGRPIFGIGFNVSPTIRSLKSSADFGKPVAYKTQVFPTISFDIDFFPFALALDNSYLAGFGLTTSVGFGFLNSRFSANANDVHKCSDNGDGTITCDTKYIRFNIDLIYRLLLQKQGGKLNPNGLALDFFAGLNLARYNVDSNPTYTGHDYTGINLGLRFHTPLGLDNLRLALALAFDINAGQGSLEKLSKWGSLIEKSWGLNFAVDLSYDIWKGIFVKAGYSLTYMYDDFGGTGCLDSNCLLPRNAESKDLYHEIMLGLGYRLY
ncbi:MAG: PEGA domain-containing protein [Proteobacteria bacterium]|nr:PEGA domain-containing protein [Pseudomonadota bacterium]